MRVNELDTVPNSPIIIRSRLPTPEEREECKCNIETIFDTKDSLKTFEKMVQNTVLFKEDWLKLSIEESLEDTNKIISEILEKLYLEEVLNDMKEDEKLPNLAPALYLAKRCDCTKHLRNHELVQYIERAADSGDLETFKILIELIEDWNQPLNNVTPLMVTIYFYRVNQ